jgi:Rad3-related DNA helicase
MQLDARLAELVERVEQLNLKRSGTLRRAFDRARLDLNEVTAVIDQWIPMPEGRPVFLSSTFYDVERDNRDDVILAARVLLPNEFLGRNYYPELKTGVFLSATTWLQDGFSAARAYLGLDRAEHPAEDEEREPCKVRTFRAPDVFDYKRVLIAIPRDAPVVTDKTKFLDYVRRFVTFLGERTHGRMLVLFTNSQDVKQVGEDTTGFFRARRIPLLFQNMEGSAKEELSEVFRSTVSSILFGVDTFWYGADFPGETLEYLVIVRLPYGVPDRYHHAQCAILGANEQRRQIYVPRALAKFRQGFGRLMRRESDRGCVFVLDGRVSDPRHRFFLRELPIERAFDAGTSPAPETSGARLVRGDTDHCVHEALAHMNLLADVKRRGLDESFRDDGRPLRAHDDDAVAGEATRDAESSGTAPRKSTRRRPPPPGPFDIPHEELPF